MKLALDFSSKPAPKAKKTAGKQGTVKVDFRPMVFMRDRTHTYLWLRDGYKYGHFLTMDSGSIAVVSVDIVQVVDEPEIKADKKAGIKAKPAVTHDAYRVYEDREHFWDLTPHKYDLLKAVRSYHESTLRRTPEAEREMRQLLGIPLDAPADARVTGQGEIDKQPRAERKREPKAEKAPAGYTLQELCAELKLDPTEARKALRAAKVEKPGGRWEWPNAEAAAKVRSVLEAL